MNRTIFAFALLSALLAASSAAAQTRWVAPTWLQRTPLQLRAPLFRLPVRPIALVTPTSTITPTPTPAPRPGTLGCRVEDNGAWAPGRMSVLRDGARVAEGSCGSGVSLAAGTYDVVLTLDGALDRPQRTVRVTVPEGGRVEATARFATGILEVRFTAGGTPAYGTVILRRDGQQVATVAGGVPARLSAGRYEVVTRYRTTERVHVVDLAPGQRRAILAAF